MEEAAALTCALTTLTRMSIHITASSSAYFVTAAPIRAMSAATFLHPPAYQPLPTAPPLTPPPSPTMYPHLPAPPSYHESFASPSLSHSAAPLLSHPSSSPSFISASLSSSLSFLSYLLHSAQLGLSSFVQGFLLAWNDTRCFSTQRRAIVLLLAVTCLTYVSLLTVFLPLRFLFSILLWCLSWVVRPSGWLVGVMGGVLDVRAFWSHVLLLLVPSVAVFVSTHLFGHEALFFSVLRSLSPSLCAALQCRRKPALGMAIVSFLKRLVVIGGLLLLLSVVTRLSPSLLPYLVVIRYSKLLMSLTARCPRWVQWTLLGCLLLLASLPSLRPIVSAFVHVQLSAMSLSRELLDSYLSRLASPPSNKPHNSLVLQMSAPVVPSVASSSLRFLTVPLPASLFSSLSTAVATLPMYGVDGAELPHRSRAVFLSQHSLSLLCFSLPFLLLLSFPVLGFGLLGFAHGSAAVLLVRLIADEAVQQKPAVVVADWQRPS